MKIDHENLDRVENHLQGNTEGQFQEYMEFLGWLSELYNTMREVDGVPMRNSTPHFLKRILGRQTTTVNFSYRNWVWQGDGYVVYADQRGLALHVPRRKVEGDQRGSRDPTFQDAMKAYRNFRRDIEDGLDKLLPGMG